MPARFLVPRSEGLPSPSHVDPKTPHSIALDPDLIRGLGLDLEILSRAGAQLACVQ